MVYKKALLDLYSVGHFIPEGDEPAFKNIKMRNHKMKNAAAGFEAGRRGVSMQIRKQYDGWAMTYD